MQQNAYEEARARLKKVQGPPLPPQLAAANDNSLRAFISEDLVKDF